MLTRTQLTLIVIAVIIIILFAITYFVLFRLAFLSRIKLIKNGLEDDKVVKHLTKKYNKYIKRHDPVTFIEKYKKAHQHSTLYTVVISILIVIVTLLSVTIIGVGLYFRLNNQQVLIDNKTFIVVETGSMSEKHPDNKYLDNYNNQIKARSLIQIEKTNDYKKYDVCAFLMDNKIIVHRIIEDPKMKDDGKLYYRFKGDANPYSLPDEFEVCEDRIIGEYTGFNSVFLGTSVLFVQSGIGMISILVSIIIYSLYSAFYDKETIAFDERCFDYLDLMYPKYHQSEEVIENEEETIIVTINNDSIIEEIKEEKVNPFANLKTTTYPEKMINNETYVRDYYNELKSYILSYKKISNRISNQYETFKLGLNKLFLLEIRGTKLKLNINVVSGLLDEKYHLKDNTTKKLEDYPVSLKIKSNRALKYAKEIVDFVLKDYELVHNYEYKDYMTLLILSYDNKKTKSYSFISRLSLAEDELRNNYNKIKNEILSYKGVKTRISHKGDTFSFKTNKLFLVEIRGQSIRLQIADKLENYPEKYHLKENKNKKAINYPIFLKVKSTRSVKYALEIINTLLTNKEFVKTEKEEIDYLLDYPKRSEDELITLGEIKVRERN